MTITPLDIQQKRFAVVWRGLDREEVDRFLNLVAQDVEGLNRELHELREETARQRRTITDFQAREQAIKETMVTAQRVTEEITENAKKEADIIIGRAELEAERLVEKAQERLTEVLSDIAEAKRQRAQFLSQMEGVLKTHERLLEVEKASDTGVEDTLKVMRKQRPETGQVQSIGSGIGPVSSTGS